MWSRVARDQVKLIALCSLKLVLWKNKRKWIDRCCGRCSFSQKRIHGKSLKAINRGRFISGVRRSIVAAGIALLPLGRKKQRGATRLDRNSRVVHFSRDNEKVSLARERKDVNGRERIKQAKKKSELKRVES